MSARAAWAAIALVFGACAHHASTAPAPAAVGPKEAAATSAAAVSTPAVPSPSSSELLTLASSSPPLPSGITEVDDTVWYAIMGNTEEAIRTQLHTSDSASTADSDFVGLTSERIEWRFHPQRDSTAGGTPGCSLRRVHVTMTVTTTLPVWHPLLTPPPSPHLLTEWDTFLTAVKRHEMGHRHLARRTAADIYAYLTTLTRPDCETETTAANEGAHARWSAGHARQIAYDGLTKHGETQGTLWPPTVPVPNPPNPSAQAPQDPQAARSHL